MTDFKNDKYHIIVLNPILIYNSALREPNKQGICVFQYRYLTPVSPTKV